MSPIARRASIGLVAAGIAGMVLLKAGTEPIAEYVFGTMAGIGYAVLIPPRKGAYVESIMGAGSFAFPLWGIANIVLFPALSSRFMEAGFSSMQEQLPDLFLWILFGVLFSFLMQLGSDGVDALWGKEAQEDAVPPVASRHILILGGGFAGMKTAEELEERLAGDSSVSITLVSETNALLFTPMLAEVAGSSLEPSHISPPLRTSLRYTQVVRGSVTSIDLEKRAVVIDGTGRNGPGHELKYDHLVLALGAVSNYLGMANVEKSAFNFKTLLDAIRIRNHVIEMFERADKESDPDIRSRLLTFVVAGGGFAGVNLFDAGVFFQDDYKARPNLTLSYGLRYEGQNRISDHADWGPRFSFAYAPGIRGNSPAQTVIRGGYGWFFDRFDATYVLDAIRQNGINQQQYIIKNPDFYSDAPPPSELASSSTVAPTIYQVAPHLKAAVNMQAAIGVEHQFGKFATASATYINSRGVHQYLSDNINAYLPSTYNSATGTGTRPNGINENIYQFQSGGVYNQNQLIFNYTVRARRISLFGFYLVNFAKADTSGATYFPSNQFDPGVDYGRANFDVHNRFLLGGNLQAPYGISFSPMLVADSGQPFNITIGQDLNGDNQFNDRPAFATPNDTDTIQTNYGTFDLNPTWNRVRIPYNYGNGPGQFSMNLRISKSFGIGPKVAGGSIGSFGGPGGPGGPPPGGGGPGGGGPPGGGLGPGRLSKSGGPPKLDQIVPRRYSLNLAAMGRNISNNVNLAQPVGVLESPLFGQSNALSGGFFSSSSANRSIDLQMSLSF